MATRIPHLLVLSRQTLHLNQAGLAPLMVCAAAEEHVSRRVAVLFVGCALVATPACGSRTGLDPGDLGTGVGVEGGVTPNCAEGLVVLYSYGSSSTSTVPGLPGGAAGIAVDATGVYWTSVAPDGALGGSVMMVPLCGGSATTLASATSRSSLINPAALAVDGTDVYWASVDEASGAPGDQLMKVPVGGGTSTVIASQQHPAYLAVDPTSLYWSDDGNGTVMKAALSGGTPITLGEGEPQGVASLVVDATRVYFYARTRGIQSVPLDGGRITTLVSDDGYPGVTFSNLVLSRGSLYWASGEAQTSLWTLPVSGGTPTALVSVSQPGPIGSIAVDGVSVYWLSASSTGTTCTTAVMKVPVGGGTPTTVVSGVPGCDNALGPALGSIALDATSVYWTTGSAVMKMTPK
jgi:hypothetical protein